MHKQLHIEVDVLRLDLIHSVVSGNKWFKLKYYLEAAVHQGKRGLISFGGAYSNHLVALAYACKQNHLQSAGIIRGEEQKENESIREMKKAGMRLFFISRADYKQKDLSTIPPNDLPDFLLVPEGGQGPEGERGASEILSGLEKTYTHIVCAVGTGTTLKGLTKAAGNKQHMLGISALKINTRENGTILEYLRSENLVLNTDFHFGGYAKHNDELTGFMNSFYMRENIPSDFVYTGKMFFAVESLISSGYFEYGSRLLLIHTGGLQGNKSLAPGRLVF